MNEDKKTRNYESNLIKNNNCAESFIRVDLELAAALASINYKILEQELRLSEDNGFLFEYSIDIVLAIEDYWRGELEVNPVALFKNYHKLNNILSQFRLNSEF